MERQNAHTASSQSRHTTTQIREQGSVQGADYSKTCLLEPIEVAPLETRLARGPIPAYIHHLKQVFRRMTVIEIRQFQTTLPRNYNLATNLLQDLCSAGIRHSRRKQSG